MREVRATGQNPLVPEDRNAEPYRDGVAGEEKPPPLRLQSPEKLLYSPPNLTSTRRPVASWGRFKNGEIALHFRVYRRRGPGIYAITGDGASFTPAEFAVIVRRVRELCREDVEWSTAMPEWAPQSTVASDE